MRTKGAEVGVRTKIIPGLDSSVSLFLLDQAPKSFSTATRGDTSPSRPSQRYGVEWTNNYRPISWLDHRRRSRHDACPVSRVTIASRPRLYASLAGFPQAQIGNAPGNYIPNAPAMVASAGITIGEKTGWFGTLRWRYLGASPLTEDNAFRSPPTSIFNGRIGYRFDNGWRIHSTCSTCSTPRPTRSPTPMAR